MRDEIAAYLRETADDDPTVVSGSYEPRTGEATVVARLRFVELAPERRDGEYGQTVVQRARASIEKAVLAARPQGGALTVGGVAWGILSEAADENGACWVLELERTAPTERTRQKFRSPNP